MTSCQVGHQKIDPWISTIFLIKVFENVTHNTDLITVSIAFSSSFESLFHQTNIWNSAVTRALAFSVAQNVSKWRQSVNKR